MIAGRYALGRELGRGGMGAVWLGTDEVLGRPVALKRLAPAGSPSTARAEREARLAARLSHPNVVAVYDLVTEGEDHWLVMEYVEGRTLTARISADGPMSPDEAAPVLAEVADALAAAHASGVVHRDVKPSNILLDVTGSAKLTDFGVARSDEADMTLTQTGFVTGSPAYLAPEVAAGRPATAASDVWSLGATAFHMLSGRPPYEVGDNVVGAMYRIVHEEPPRTDRAGWLAPMVAGAMTRDPAERWTLRQVQAFLAGDTTEATRTLPAVAAVAPPAGPPRSALAGRRARPAARRRRLPPAVWPVLAGLLVLLLLVLALVLTHPWSRGGSPTAGPHTSTGATSRSASPSPAGGPTEDGIRQFVSTYLTTASTDPARGFAMLTPDYQARSGGLKGYERFWGNVRNVHDLADVTPSLDPLGVSYRYSYTLRGSGKRTEEVHLRLVYQDGRYLIDGT